MTITILVLFGVPIVGLPEVRSSDRHADKNTNVPVNSSRGMPSDRLTSHAAAKIGLSQAYGQLPLYFEANRGQTDRRVKFLSRGGNNTFFLTPTEVVMVMSKAERPEASPWLRRKAVTEKQQHVTAAVLRMRFVGAGARSGINGLFELPGKANYFIGNDPARWRTNVPTYALVEYENLYPGIDLRYYGNQRQLEHDFIVRPGADPRKVALKFSGADRLDINKQGDLVLHTPVGAIHQGKPLMYQEIDGVRTEVAGGYVLNSANEVGFRVAAYDRSRPLVIDPVLFYSTYLGGSGYEQPFFSNGIAVDNGGNAYVTGFTNSLNFPTTPGAFRTIFAGGTFDAFVTKLNPTGSGLVYSTYLGGSTGDQGMGIALDSSGNAYISGSTDSLDFPITANAFQSVYGGGTSDAFVAKLNTTGSSLVYSSYLGGNSGGEQAPGIAVDIVGNAYVTGGSNSTNFPTTPGAIQSGCAAGNAYVTKVDPSGTLLLYSTFFGTCGSTNGGKSIAVNTAGEAFVTGDTGSLLPVTPGAFQPTSGGGFDGYVVKLNAAGTGLIYSCFLGGSNNDFPQHITIDAAGNAYIAGQTFSPNFPTIPGAFQSTFQGGSIDGFVTKVNPLGTGLVYSTFLGGAGNDGANGVGVDLAGNAYVTGATSSTNFPITPDAFQTAFAGGPFDAFVTKLSVTGSAVVYSSYLGGSGEDNGQSLALDDLPNPNAYVVGLTNSTNFPTTPGAFQTTFAGGTFDAFVAKVANIVLPPPPTVGKVTGGGSINVTNGIGTFGFIVQRQAADGSIAGDLQYVNHATGARVHSLTFLSFNIVGNTADFSGTCTNNNVPCTFTVNVTDNGEPGTTDSFTISVSGGPTDGGTLRSGNIQIHQ